MKVSIVICTYRRPEEAKSLLIKLERQEHRDFEVLVICQGNKKDLEEIQHSVKANYPVRYYYEAHPNLPHARNVGIKESSGEIILFLDDDAKPGDNLIETHIANYIDPTVGVIGGRVLGEAHIQNVPDYKIGMARRFDGFNYSGFHKNVRRNVMHVRGINMSVKRNVALEVNGFDERFEGSAEYEDLDFCLRVLKKGYKIIFDPTAVIEHIRSDFGGCRTGSEEERAYWLYRNHSFVFLKNFNKLFYPVLIAEYTARIIRRSVCWHNWRIIGYAYRGIRDGWRAYFK